MSKSLQDNLTEGGVFRKLIKFALPMLLTSLLQSLYGIADIVIVGQVDGNSAITAVSNSGLIINMITQVAVGLTVGGNVLLSQYYGSKDHENRRLSAGTLFSFCMLLGVIVAAVVFIFTEQIVTLINSPAYEEACAYMRICSIGIIMTFGYNALSAVIRSAGNSRHPLYFIIIASVINVGLDIVLVVGYGMGAAGAAYATVFSQFGTFVAALIFVLRNRKFYGFELSNIRIRLDKLKKILHVGVPTALQMVIGGISWTVVTIFINRYNSVDISAAAGAANKVRELAIVCISSVSSGASTMIAQNLGAGLYDRAKKVLNCTLVITAVIAVVVIAIVEPLAPYLVSIFTKDSTAVNYAAKFLRIDILSVIFYAGFMSYHALAIGAGHTLFVMFNSFMNCIPARILLVYFLEKAIGLEGIFWGCMIAPAVSVPIGAIYERSKIWRRQLN